MKSAGVLAFALSLGLAHARPAHAAWPKGPTTNLPVCTDLSTQGDDNLCADGVGGTIVAWTDDRQGGGVIYAQRLRPDGTPVWTPNGVPLCTTVTYAQSPVLQPDGHGGAIVAWQDGRPGNGYDVYAQRVDSTGARLWTPTGVPVCTATGTQQLLSICTDGAGGAIVAWNDDRTPLRRDVYVQRVTAAGGLSWTIDGVLLCNVLSIKSQPLLAADGRGGAWVAWTDARPPANGYDAYVQYVSPTGATRMSVNGERAFPGLVGQQSQAIVPDAVGGCIVLAYGNRGSDNYDVGAQRFIYDLGSVRRWGSNGVTLAAAPGLQYLISAAADGRGGVVAAWDDTRNAASGQDIYGQRADSTGAMLWGANGAAICTAAGTQSNPRVAADSAGGALIAWDDARGPDLDVYVQRMSAAGLPLWTPDGVAVSLDTLDQARPHLVANPAGEPVIEWNDGRNGNADVYAQWVDAQGNVGGPTTGVAPGAAPPGLALAPLSPNPARGTATARWELPRAAHVRLALLDVSGRERRVLADGTQAAGRHESAIDLRDAGGRALEPGLYFVRLDADGRSLAGRLVVVQ
jgi:hypothetical protein